MNTELFEISAEPTAEVAAEPVAEEEVKPKKRTRRKAKAAEKVAEPVAESAPETTVEESAIAEKPELPEIKEDPVVAEQVCEPVAEQAAEPVVKKKSKNKKEAAELAKNYVDIDYPVWLYKTSVATRPFQQIRGRYYLWSQEVVTGRICVTERESGIGDLKKIAGWINASILK